MKRCPICGADLAHADKVRRMLKMRTTQLAERNFNVRI